MALAKIILRKQQRVGEHYAQHYIIVGDAGFSLESYRGVRLSSRSELRSTCMPKIPHLLAVQLWRKRLGAVGTP
jgi:hypothetical protein